VGYERALEDARIVVRDEWIIEMPLHVIAARKAMVELLKSPDPPTAVFINSNLLSLGALLAVEEAGSRCPGGVSRLRFDDRPWVAVSAPPLTTIRQPSQQVGRVAAEVLLGLINGEEPGEMTIRLEWELIERESCCAPADCTPEFSR